MKKKMSDKHKLMAYVLSTDADLNANKKITQKEIAKLFDVKQSTISQAIKETALKLENAKLQKELSEAKQKIYQLEGIDTLSLPDYSNDEYHRKW